MDVASINCLDTSTDTDICTNNTAFCESNWDQCICRDINECNTGIHNCDLITSECINIDAGFTCNCLNQILPSGKLSGYREENGSCVDIDECSEDSNICKCSSCINTVGNYKCECASTSSKRLYLLCRLDILFSSNHNIHKSSCGLCVWASDTLINRFY